MSRMYQRLQIGLPAIVTINPTEQGERILLLRTVDISAAGAMFCSEQSLFPDAPVKVVFLLKQRHSLKNKLRIVFAGRVIRCEPGRFAVAFDEVYPILLSKCRSWTEPKPPAKF
jgi:hypothetical protein